MDDIISQPTPWHYFATAEEAYTYMAYLGYRQGETANIAITTNSDGHIVATAYDQHYVLREQSTGCTEAMWKQIQAQS